MDSIEIRRVPKFGACGNCLFDERSVIVFLHLMALICGVVSAIMAAGDGLTMSFFEPIVPIALQGTVSTCPSAEVGKAPFLYLALSDYVSGEGGYCKVNSVSNLQATFNVNATSTNVATTTVTAMAVLNILVTLGLFGIAIGEWREKLFIDSSNSGGLMCACFVPAVFSFTGAMVTSVGWKTACLSLPDSSCFAPSCWEQQIYCCDLTSTCTSDSQRFNSTTLMDAYSSARVVEGLFWGAGVSSLVVVFLYASMARSGRKWHRHTPVAQRQSTKLEAW